MAHLPNVYIAQIFVEKSYTGLYCKNFVKYVSIAIACFIGLGGAILQGT